MHGQSHAGSQAELATILHAQWFYGAHKNDDAPHVTLPLPFASPADDEPVTDEEREQLVAELTRRSAFSN